MIYQLDDDVIELIDRICEKHEIELYGATFTVNGVIISNGERLINVNYLDFKNYIS